MPKRSPHPGVRLYPRQRKVGVTWFAKVQRLPGGRWVDVNLTKLGLHTAQARALWAHARSREILARRAGVAPSITLADAVEGHLARMVASNAAPRSVTNRRAVARQIVRVLGPLVRVDSVGPRHLEEVREGLCFGAVSSQRNRLGNASSFWHELWERSLTPQLSRDDLWRALNTKRMHVVEAGPFALTPAQIAQLLDGLEHDAVLHRFARFVLLTGMRRREASELPWSEVKLASRAIDLPAARCKTRRARRVSLLVCPSVEDMLHELPQGEGAVLGLSDRQAGRRIPKLRAALPEAEGLGWHHLRKTCASYLHSAPGIRWAPHVKAKQLGHGVQMAERTYADVVEGIHPRASTLEEAMGMVPVTAENSGGGEVLRLA